MQKYNIKNIKKYMIGAMICALPFAACEKDPVEPTPVTPTPVTPTTPKTYTYMYDGNGVPQDTLMAYTNVDTFYVMPVQYDLFATRSETAIHNLRNHLENCVQLNCKTHGKGLMRAKNASVEDSVWLAQFGYIMQR